MRTTTDGVRRLVEAVAAAEIRHIPKQKLEAKQRRVVWCHLWEPGDTIASFLQRNPGQGTHTQVLGKISKLRRHVPGLQRSQRMPPYEVTRAYLSSLHAGSPKRNRESF